MKQGNRIRKNTYNAPEYELGRGATIDLVILFIRPCISCSESKKGKLQMFIIGYLKKKDRIVTFNSSDLYPSKFPSMADADKNCY